MHRKRAEEFVKVYSIGRHCSLVSAQIFLWSLSWMLHKARERERTCLRIFEWEQYFLAVLFALKRRNRRSTARRNPPLNSRVCTANGDDVRVCLGRGQQDSGSGRSCEGLRQQRRRRRRLRPPPALILSPPCCRPNPARLLLQDDAQVNRGDIASSRLKIIFFLHCVL